MATSEKLQHEFVIGNRSQELFEIVISVCDPRKDNSRFPAYVRTELGGEMIRAAREIMRCCLFANGCRDVDRFNYQRDACNNVVYLNFLTRTAYDKGWINTKQHDRIIRYTGELTNRIYNWRRATTK
nr:MAG TPA: Avd-like protein [Caudoviricetes sp.]